MRKRLLVMIALIVGTIFTISPAGQTLNTQIQIAINQLTTGVTPFTRARIGASDYINWGAGTDVNGYGIRDNAGTMEFKNSGGAWNPVTGGSVNPSNASYWTRVPEASLSNETPLSALATALLLNTTTTGVPVAYAGTSCTNQFIRSLSLIGAATCASVDINSDTSGTISVSRGGTGLTAGTSGGILAYTAAGTLASSGILATNALVLGGGAGAVPVSLPSGLGTTVTLLHGNAAGAPTFGAVALAADVSGTLPVTNGGTGLILYAVGDLVQASTTTALARLAAVATGNVLLSGGVGTVSSFGKVGLTTHVTGTLPVANGGTGLASYTTGDILYASAAGTIAGRAAVGAGQVLSSAGVGVAPTYTATPTVTTLTTSTSFKLSTVADATAAPTIASGFGTGSSIVGSNGTAAFQVNVGTGGVATGGVINVFTSTTGWICIVTNQTAVAANRGDQRTVQTASTTGTVTIQNQTISTGAALAWTASDKVMLSCRGY